MDPWPGLNSHTPAGLLEPWKPPTCGATTGRGAGATPAAGRDARDSEVGSLGSLQLYVHVLPPPDTELPADSLSKHHRSLPARPWSGTEVEKGGWCVGCASQGLGKEEQALRLARSYSSKGISLPHPQASGLGLTNALCSEQKWIQLKMQKEEERSPGSRQH